MVFECDGARYDTDGLLSHESGPVIVYWTRDRSKVFIQTFNRWTGTEIRSVPAEQVRPVAEHYGIRELLDSTPF